MKEKRMGVQKFLEYMEKTVRRTKGMAKMEVWQVSFVIPIPLTSERAKELMDRKLKDAKIDFKRGEIFGKECYLIFVFDEPFC